MIVDWQPYDIEHKAETEPPYDKLVWIYEEDYHGVVLGFHDGFTFNTWWGSDDVNVSHWAALDEPDEP